MSSLIAVLDACVLVPASLCDLLLRAASADLYQLHWTDDILEEVRRTLVGDLNKSDEQARKRIVAMKTAFPQAFIAAHKPLIDAMPNDPKDRHVLAAAVVSGAQIIVTSNLRDFPPHLLAPFGVEAQSPDQFLTSLFDLGHKRMKEVIERQARALRNPPMTVADVLDALAKEAPRFATLVRAALDKGQDAE